ncbi:lactate utilization protein [Desulfococcaceae bacterium HSG8]|nr:lactate utilization protein [Desulfococcaceae bacterium HSG8]
MLYPKPEERYLNMEQAELLKTMKEKAEGVQAVVSCIKSLDDAFDYLIDLTEKQGGRAVTAPGLNGGMPDILKKRCEERKLKLLTPPLRPHTSDIHASLTLADWGIAETGTLVLNSGSEDIRIATMLAETHVAVLRASKIRKSAGDLEDELNAVLKAGSPAYMAFITGASRTADIERVLAIGVHGPQELHILIMED